MLMFHVIFDLGGITLLVCLTSGYVIATEKMLQLFSDCKCRVFGFFSFMFVVEFHVNSKTFGLLKIFEFHIFVAWL